MAGEDEYFGVDEEQVAYAGRPVAVGSEQDRITKAMRRQRDKQAQFALAKSDMERSLAGGVPTNPDNLNEMLQTGRLKVSQVPVLPVASGPYVGTEEFTEANGAPSSLPGGFGIQPQAWGTGNRKQRAFEQTLEAQANHRDRRTFEHDLRIGDREATNEMRKAFEVFKNNLPASAKMKFSAYLREQARNAKLGATKEKPASWLDLGRFQEWEREQREIEYRQTVADKGEESPEAKALLKRIGIDPSKKWTAARRVDNDDKESAARLKLAEEQAAALKAERERKVEERKLAEEAKKTEGGKKALAALRRIRDDAYKGSWSRAMQAVTSSMDAMGLTPEEIADRAAALANKLYKAEVDRLLRGVSPEEIELIKKHGLEGKLFEMDQTRPAGAGGEAAPAAPADAAPGEPGDEDPAAGKGAAGGTVPGAAGGSGAPVRPWRPAPPAPAASPTPGARPAPMRGPGTELPAPLPQGTARGQRPAFTPRSGGPELTPFDAGRVRLPDYTWDSPELQAEQGRNAANRLMERPAGAAVVTGDMSEYAGASPATLENIARLKAQGVGEKAGELLAGDARRRNVSYGSIDGGEEVDARDVADEKGRLDRATTILMKMPPPARAAELAKMRANPQPYIAAGVPVEDILAMYQGA